MTSLTKNDVSRYSRQLILPELGVKGQEKLKNISILIVGGGGLGCPAAIYLAAAGIGKLGIIDYDKVEINNLHRQILHTEAGIGVSKAQSIADAVKRLNSSIECVPFEVQLTNENALSIINNFDVVVDASDNAPTRYLLNDACVLTKKPLVSGSALRFEGQLTVYNYEGSPCYRCLYPTPVPPHLVTNCSDGGVIGAVPGVIGTLQALEVIKIASGLPVSYAGKLLIYDGFTGAFRTVKLRSKQKDCSICGETPSITTLQNYEEFCDSPACDKQQKVQILQQDQRIDSQTYKEMVDKHIPHLLIDVREPAELDICKLNNSYNLPINKINNPESLEKLKAAIKEANKSDINEFEVVVVCRRGNDSQRAVKSLSETFKDNMKLNIRDIIGGLYAWAQNIDPELKLY